MKPKWLAVISLTMAVLPSTSCKPEISNANIEAVNSRKEKADQRKGLSPKEVESILGQPDRTETATLELETQKKQIPVTRYYYEQNGEVIELHFIDNKLINRVPHWPNQPATEPKKP